jgi:hypothetical protein
VRFTPIPIILTPRRQVDIAAGAHGDEGELVAGGDFIAAQHDASGNNLVGAIGQGCRVGALTYKTVHIGVNIDLVGRNGGTLCAGA